LIKNKDRSYYIGASDTNFVVGNWETKSFAKWWLEKLKLNKNDFTNKYMLAGNNFEHKILDALKIKGLKKDKQIKKGRLRVNLDGNTKEWIWEVKTYNYYKGFVLTSQHKQQLWVQMWASKIKKGYIVSYGLYNNDYKNYFNEIDKKRLKKHKVEYNDKWIECEYLPKLKYLTKCLKKKTMPNKKTWEELQEMKGDEL
jgi:hypothetical protein